MTDYSKTYGAKAHVYLEYSGDLKSLVKNLETGLNLPEFWFKTDQDFPHDEFGMCETLGFEINVSKSQTLKDYKYCIEFLTSDCTQEIINDRMHDTSLWFAKFISQFIDINSAVLNESNESYIFFKDGVISSTLI